MDLPGDRALRPGEDVLHVLLGDRRAPLAHRSAGHVRPRGARDGEHVETVVPVEVSVLDRHHGMAKRHRHLGERDQHAVHSRVQFRDLVPIAIQQHRRLRQRRDVRELRRHVQREERARDGEEREEHRQERDPGEPAAPAPRRGRRHRDPRIIVRRTRGSDRRGSCRGEGSHGFGGKRYEATRHGPSANSPARRHRVVRAASG